MMPVAWPNGFCLGHLCSILRSGKQAAFSKGKTLTQQSEGFKAKVLLAAIVVTIVGLPVGALALRQSMANSSRMPISLLDDDGSADQGRGDTTDSAETSNEGGDVSDPPRGRGDNDNSGSGHGDDNNSGSGHDDDNDDSGSGHGDDNDNSGSGHDDDNDDSGSGHDDDNDDSGSGHGDDNNSGSSNGDDNNSGSSNGGS